MNDGYRALALKLERKINDVLRALQTLINVIDKLEELDEQYYHVSIFKESKLIDLFKHYHIEPFGTFGNSNKGLLKKRIINLKKDNRETLRALAQQIASILE